MGRVLALGKEAMQVALTTEGGEILLLARVVQDLQAIAPEQVRIVVVLAEVELSWEIVVVVVMILVLSIVYWGIL